MVSSKHKRHLTKIFLILTDLDFSLKVKITILILRQVIRNEYFFLRLNTHVDKSVGVSANYSKRWRPSKMSNWRVAILTIEKPLLLVSGGTAEGGKCIENICFSTLVGF